MTNDGMTKEIRMTKPEADRLRSAHLAATMQSEKRLALTLTLSPRRGNRQWPRLENQLPSEHSPALQKSLPLTGGEGWDALAIR